MWTQKTGRKITSSFPILVHEQNIVAVGEARRSVRLSRQLGRQMLKSRLLEKEMRFLVNKVGTQRWDELTADGIVDWVKESKDKEIDKKTKEWLAIAKPGEVYVYGVYRIVAVQLG
jgi:hypothetical protein